jgi:hypothetical protein
MAIPLIANRKTALPKKIFACPKFFFNIRPSLLKIDYLFTVANLFATPGPEKIGPVSYNLRDHCKTGAKQLRDYQRSYTAA